MSLKWSKYSSLTKELPCLVKIRKQTKKNLKKEKLITSICKYVRWYQRQIYGTEQAKVAKHYGREFIQKLIEEDK